MGEVHWRLVLDSGIDVINGLPDRLDLLGLVVWNLNVEFFFQLHDELDDVERVPRRSLR